jgi:hypothetical protein
MKYRNYGKARWEIEKEEAERKRQEDIARGLERTEENFPQLGNATAKTLSWGGRKFTDLANEWKEQEDMKKSAETEVEKPVEDTDDFIMPKFQPTFRYYEPEQLPEEKPVAQEDDGWVTVDNFAKKKAKQAKKQARLQEKLRRYDDGGDLEYNDESDEEKDDTCWNGDLDLVPLSKKDNV